MKNRFAVFATVLLIAASVHAQQPAAQPGTSPAGAQNAPATTPVVQTVPNALQAVDTEALGPIQNAGTLRIRAGSGTVVTMQAGIMRVAVGDERLLAVHVLEPREILLQGVTAGRSTLFVWLTDRQRLRYDVIVVPKIDILRSSLRDLDPSVEAELSADGAAIVLRGDVASEKASREALAMTQNVIGGDAGGVRIINLLHFPPASTESEQALAAAMESVDPRIRVRKIQVAVKDASGPLADAIVLEGRVRNLSSLVRAMTLADMQMGGGGAKIEPVNNDVAQGNRGGGGAGGGFGAGGGGTPGGTLPSFVARGLVLRAGKVISFLEVDDLPQIMVSIRALQVDRGKARQLGIDYRIDARHVSIGSYNHPGGSSLGGNSPGADARPNILGGAGNLLAAFVDQTVAITAAIDLLEQKSVARSVAEPNITTLSGEEASVLVGGSIPIPSTTVGNVTATQGFNFAQFGVRLDIRPTLNPNGIIALELSPSIIKPSIDLSVGGVPGFEIQTVQTNAKVAPGQSLVIGGLLSFDDTIEKRGVPGLSSIPVIKHLFSWDNKRSSEKELIFVITPRVLNEASMDRPLDDTISANIEPLPFGKSPVLPAVNAKSDDIYKPAPTQTRRPNSLPPEFPLQPIVAAPGEASPQTSAYVMAPPPPPPPAAEVPAEPARPAPQAPRTELPPPPSPTNP